VRLAPGERLTFGRGAACAVRIPHGGVSRRAGEITAQGAFWVLNNLSGRQTYVVENPEGAGEHIKVGPGRLEAPVPFEFSRIVLPAAGDLIALDVWAPRHDYLRADGDSPGSARRHPGDLTRHGPRGLRPFRGRAGDRAHLRRRPRSPRIPALPGSGALASPQSTGVTREHVEEQRGRSGGP
jgi:hypothetical protein